MPNKIIEVYNKSSEKSFIILKESVLSGNPRAFGNSVGPVAVCLDPGKTLGLEEKTAKFLLHAYPEYLMLMSTKSAYKRKSAKKA
jgi:hypothetical protein